MEKLIAGKTRDEWKAELPLVSRLMAKKETFWFNTGQAQAEKILPGLDIGPAQVQDAADRLDRFAPYIAKVFPETRESKGIIESPLAFIPHMQKKLSQEYSLPLPGRLMLKYDNALPISGSIKARGGIYEVLKLAETLALEKGMLSLEDNYACLAEKEFANFFSRFSIAVGSTGNLGLSIGIMGACLGFRVSVHMSADARQWKKDLLRSKGVTVVEYEGDYSQAVAQGRKQAMEDPGCHFVDDENSLDLFMGYAVAAQRLKSQLDELQIKVDQDHPLFVHLPCGVGGAPGGITFGLKLIFRDNVHCFFAEPTHSPAMFLGVYTGLHDKICVQDLGIDNITAADGLAVGRPSGFTGKRLEKIITGFYTISDNHLHGLLALLADAEDILMEPSALAGLDGLPRLIQQMETMENTGGIQNMEKGVHIAWGTGGSMVPDSIMETYYQKGKGVLEQGFISP